MVKKKRPNKLGQLGPRYGRSIKEKLRKVFSKKTKKHICPACKHPKVGRADSAIFECRKCGYKFAGGAYYPETMSGGFVRKLITQKRNMLQMDARELAELKAQAAAEVDVEVNVSELEAEEEEAREKDEKKKAKKAKKEEKVEEAVEEKTEEPTEDKPEEEKEEEEAPKE